MKTRKIYPRPPIVEAVVEFNFTGEISQKILLDALAPKLEKNYGGRKEQTRVDAEITVNKDHVATETRKTTPVIFLSSNDGLRLVGCANGALSLHVLAPYPGWERFFEQILDAIGELPSTVTSSKLTRIAVRYIDRILLPTGNGPLTDYIEVAPKQPSLLPKSLSAMHIVTQSSDPSDGTSALLTVAAIPRNSPDKGTEVVYDLLLHREGSFLGTLAGHNWRGIVDDLHTRQRDIFEDSFSEKTKELFK